MIFFFLINGVAAVIEVMFVFISKYGLHQDSNIAVNVAKYGFGLPLGMLFRLYCYRTFVFPEGQEEIVVPASRERAAVPGRGPAHRALRRHAYAAPPAAGPRDRRPLTARARNVSIRAPRVNRLIASLRNLYAEMSEVRRRGHLRRRLATSRPPTSCGPPPA